MESLQGQGACFLFFSYKIEKGEERTGGKSFKVLDNENFLTDFHFRPFGTSFASSKQALNFSEINFETHPSFLALGVGSWASP